MSKMSNTEKMRALKGNSLSSAEYAQVKSLKAFNASDWTWDGEQGLYIKGGVKAVANSDVDIDNITYQEIPSGDMVKAGFTCVTMKIFANQLRDTVRDFLGYSEDTEMAFTVVNVRGTKQFLAWSR